MENRKFSKVFLSRTGFVILACTSFLSILSADNISNHSLLNSEIIEDKVSSIDVWQEKNFNLAGKVIADDSWEELHDLNSKTYAIRRSENFLHRAIRSLSSLQKEIDIGLVLPALAHNPEEHHRESQTPRSQKAYFFLTEHSTGSSYAIQAAENHGYDVLVYRADPDTSKGEKKATIQNFLSTSGDVGILFVNAHASEDRLCIEKHSTRESAANARDEYLKAGFEAREITANETPTGYAVCITDWGIAGRWDGFGAIVQLWACDSFGLKEVFSDAREFMAPLGTCYESRFIENLSRDFWGRLEGTINQGELRNVVDAFEVTFGESSFEFERSGIPEELIEKMYDETGILRPAVELYQILEEHYTGSSSFEDFVAELTQEHPFLGYGHDGAGATVLSPAVSDYFPKNTVEVGKNVEATVNFDAPIKSKGDINKMILLNGCRATLGRVWLQDDRTLKFNFTAQEPGTLRPIVVSSETISLYNEVPLDGNTLAYGSDGLASRDRDHVGPNGDSYEWELNCVSPSTSTSLVNPPQTFIDPGRVETQLGLHTATFETPSGDILVNLPDDMSAGDTLTGSVIAKPDGDTPDELTTNSGELSGYVVSVQTPATQPPLTQPSQTGDGTPPDSQDPTTTAGTAQPGQYLPVSLTDVVTVATLVLEDPTGRVVDQTDIPVYPPRATPPTTQSLTPDSYNIPTLCQGGRPCAVSGVFNGDVGDSTVAIGNEGATILAESPGQTVVQSPTNTVGPTIMQVAEGETFVEGPVRNIQVNLSAGKTTLLEGEQTNLTVQIAGLQNLDEEVSVQLENLSPAIIRLQGGNSQTLLVSPDDVISGGVANYTYLLTGIATGPFNVRAIFDPTQTAIPSGIL
jgi:hypothetical protein